MPEIQTDIEGPEHDVPLGTCSFTRHDKFRQMCGQNTLMCNPIFLVKNFQEKVLGIMFPRRPQVFTKKQVDDTAEKLIEEVHEFLHADTVADRADALVDLVYFALGGLHQMGVPTEIVFQKVHEANMTKVFGKTKRNHEVDAAKPADFTPPDHSWLDEAAGNVLVGEAHGDSQT